ncbi:hypothetical protein D6D00_04174 [Aureobasidium pullulans]|nr:hypothetical protein D6D00_04174 [Aureobasidium pullulans]
MHFRTIFSVFALAAIALASLNTSREYQLHTQLKPGQGSKKRFDNLWLVASHTGAGLNDAVLYTNQSSGIKGFMNATDITQPNGQPYFNQLFDLGGSFPWGLIIADVNFYSAWEPVRVNAGDGQPSFFFNSSGLQWNENPSVPADQNAFGGWLVCDWWHGVPQLFAKWRSVYQISLVCVRCLPVAVITIMRTPRVARTSTCSPSISSSLTGPGE